MPKVEIDTKDLKEVKELVNKLNNDISQRIDQLTSIIADCIVQKHKLYKQLNGKNTKRRQSNSRPLDTAN